MSDDATAVLEQALVLDESSRADLAAALIRSLEPPEEADVEEAWREEVRRRLRAYEAGETSTVPWSEVRDQLLAKLRAARR